LSLVACYRCRLSLAAGCWLDLCVIAGRLFIIYDRSLEMKDEDADGCCDVTCSMPATTRNLHPG